MHTNFPSQQRNQVFISYSHEDREWLKRLRKMLGPMVRNHSISIWDDTQISAGSVINSEINQALSRAKVAVLLVSASFLASDFIYEQELSPLLKSAQQEGVKILWICLGACLYEETEIVNYQAVHDVNKPLDTLESGEQNQVLATICQEIKQAITGHKNHQQINYQRDKTQQKLLDFVSHEVNSRLKSSLHNRLPNSSG